MRHARAWIARVGVTALVLAATAWGALAMHFLLRFPAAVVRGLIAAWLALALAAAWAPRAPSTTCARSPPR